MKVSFDFKKRHLLIMSIFLAVAFAGVFVYAQVATPNPGHTGTEICGPVFCVDELLGISLTANNGRFIFYNANGDSKANFAYRDSSTSLFVNDIAGSESTKLILNPNGGNVGIGTNSPTRKLDVNGNVQANSFNGNQYCISGDCISSWGNAGGVVVGRFSLTSDGNVQSIGIQDPSGAVRRPDLISFMFEKNTGAGGDPDTDEHYLTQSNTGGGSDDDDFGNHNEVVFGGSQELQYAFSQTNENIRFDWQPGSGLNIQVDYIAYYNS